MVRRVVQAPPGLARITVEAERAAAVALRYSESAGADEKPSAAVYADGYLSGLCFALSVLRGGSPSTVGGQIVERVQAHRPARS